MNYLDLTGTTPVDHLPLTMLRLPLDDIQVADTHMDDPDLPIILSLANKDIDITSSPSKPSASVGAPSLSRILLGVYRTDIQPHYTPSILSGMPPHIIDEFEGSYDCQLCDRLIVPTEEGWMKEEVERAWSLNVREFVISRNWCGTHRHQQRDRLETPEPVEYIAGQLIKVKGRACATCTEKHLKPTTIVIVRVLKLPE